jgi:hypothetical protein
MYTDKGVRNYSGTPFFVRTIHQSQAISVCRRFITVEQNKRGKIQA